MTDSPRDLIRQGKWHSALFTTYSLSLSFFESYLLRDGLRKSGCREIWVVSDIDGYNDSLAERQSRSVGQDYRLVPVAMPHGVFHPKCTYLSGPDGDLLMIGSGNLTFGGHGRNIEVIEAFRSTEHPNLFQQFGEFLTALRRRTDFINPETEWVDRFQRLAEMAGVKSGTGEPGQVEIVHSTEQTILDQLGQRVSLHGGASGARLLSPYFDPKAEAVSKLAEELRIKSPVIGLISGQESRSGYPFGASNLPKTKSAAIDVEKPRRKLHAKWCEVDLNDGSRLTLTGSVNATRQALCSTNNIEVGILRAEEIAQAKRLHWTKADPPTTSAIGKYLPPGLGARVLLHARLSEDARLVGQLFAKMELSGTWHGVLSRADGHSRMLRADVDADGKFSAKVEGVEEFERASGLQLRLVKGTAAARCWVQNEWLIEVAQISNVPTAAILALFRGDASEQDELDFLGFLTEGIAELAPQIAAISRSRGEAEKVEKPPTLHSVTVDALATREPEESVGPLELGDTRGRRVSQMLNRLLRQFEEDESDGAGAVQGADEDGGDVADDEVVVDTEKVEERRVARRTENSLLKLREVVKSNVNGGLGLAAKRAMLGLWLVVELRMHLRTDAGAAAGRRFAREWLLTTAHATRCGGQSDSIDEEVLLVTAILGAAEADGAVELVSIHEAVEDFFGPEVIDAARVDQIRLPPLFARLGQPATDLAAGLKRVLAAHTRRQEIEIVRNAVAARTPLGPGLAVLSSTDGRALQEALAARRVVKFVELEAGRGACPCNMTLRPAELATIRRLRFGRCVQCGAFLYSTSAAT